MPLQVTERGNAVILFTDYTYCTIKAHKLPPGSALGSQLMSFIDVPQYKLPLLRQTAPLSSADTQLEHRIKECKDYFCAHFCNEIKPGSVLTRVQAK